jgi:hypothetical protein
VTETCSSEVCLIININLEVCGDDGNSNTLTYCNTQQDAHREDTFTILLTNLQYVGTLIMYMVIYLDFMMGESQNSGTKKMWQLLGNSTVNQFLQP